MKKHRYLIGLTIIIAWLPISLWGQEDHGNKIKDLAKPNMQKLWLPNTPVPQLNSKLPTTPPMNTEPLLPSFTLPEIPTIPYATNPSPMFKGDYHTDGTLLSYRLGGLWGTGQQTTLPGIGRFNEASVGYWHQWNDKLSFQLNLNAMKVNMNHLNGQAFSTSGKLLYQATDKLSFSVFGTYAMGNTYGMNTHLYGGTARWQVTDRFGLEVGAQRYYDSMRGGWQTVPIVIPSYRFDHFKLELDVGGILYEILRGAFESKNDIRGATIAPPKFSFPSR